MLEIQCPSESINHIFKQTSTVELNKPLHKKIFLHTYINSCISQMNIFHIVVINKGIKHWCNFFVVPGYGLSFLEMPYCEGVVTDCEMPSNIWSPPMTNSKQDKSKPKNNSKDVPNTNNKCIAEAHYFIAGANAETNRDTNAKTAINIYKEFSNVISGLDASKAPAH